MKKRIISFVMAFMVCLSSLGAWSVSASQSPVVDRPVRNATTSQPHLPIIQLIVKFKPETQVAASLKQMTESMAVGAAVDMATQAVRAAEAAVSKSAGVEVQYFRPMSGEAHVFRLNRRYEADEAQALADRVSRDPDVEYAEPDWPMQALMTPNDLYYTAGYMWDLKPEVISTSSSTMNYGMDLPSAWEISVGDPNLRVAVLDTGILKNHPDLYGRWIGGYDFISLYQSPYNVANDGDGRDPDPSDPGDWIPADDPLCGYGTQIDSSWHGSHVAGTIGASGNNAAGIIGINPISKILPVRVLGRCGGLTSDIVDGLRWAVGLPVTGVPNNPYPARVLNFSLGGTRPSSCASSWQSAINEANALGTIIVVAAGNLGADAGSYSPSNCQGVITVGATDMAGINASYSNYGSTVEIWAPGGDGDYPLPGRLPNLIYSSINTSKTSPNPAGYDYAGYQGTSMAAPHISGLVSLMLSKKPTLTLNDILTILQKTSIPFNPSSECMLKIISCGPSGIANAREAMRAVVGVTAPPVLSSLNPSQVTRGSTGFTLIVNGSNFTSNSVVRWKGVDRSTTFISDMQLSIGISAADVAQAGSVPVTVYTPAPVDASSAPLNFTINLAPSDETWTFMLYLDGDTGKIDGGTAHQAMLRALEHLGQNSSAYVKIVGLIDGPGSQDTYRVTFTPQANYQSVAEKAMDDPATLVDFVTTARTEFPAKHYYLAIADHANGVQGIAWDTTSNANGTAYLTPAELHQAMASITNNGASPIDVVHFDGSSFGLLENAYNLKGLASYMISSENVVWPNFGYDAYRALVTYATDPLALGKGIAQSYAASMVSRQLPYTISVLDLSRSDAAATALKGFAGQLQTFAAASQANATLLVNARTASQKFESGGAPAMTIDDSDYYVDLADFANRVKTQVADAAVQTAATNLVSALSGASQPLVVYQSHGNGSFVENGSPISWALDGANGVSIYYPAKQGGAVFTDYQNGVTFSTFGTNSSWDAYLLAGVPPLGAGDPVPSDQPEPLNPPAYYSYIYLPVIRK